jgi:hypothetical protein
VSQRGLFLPGLQFSFLCGRCCMIGLTVGLDAADGIERRLEGDVMG